MIHLGGPPDAPRSYLWRPGGTAGHGIYTDINEIAALACTISGERRILIDSSQGPTGFFGLPAAIISSSIDFNPPGIYGNVKFIGLGANQATPHVLQTAVGAAVTLKGVSGFFGGLIVDNHSTADLLTLSDAAGFFELNDSSQIYHDGDAAFLKCASSGLFIMRDGSSVQSAAGKTNAIQVVAGGSAVLYLEDSAILNANMLSVSGGGGAAVTLAGNAVYGTQASAAAIVPTGGREKGTATLSSGVTAAITCCMAAGTRVIITPKTFSGTALTWDYEVTNRTNGPQGSFKITARLASDHTATNTADGSSFDWQAIN